MSRTAGLLTALLLFLGTLPGARAQTSSASGVVAPAGPVQVNLGESGADLFGPWRFHTGDNPAWAQPDFDDSGWSTMDLRAPDDPPGLEPGQSGYAPGWTAQGYPKYSGYAWYRLRVNVQDAHKRLALKMPGSFDDAYEVFVNGQKIGDFGIFHGNQVTTYSALPRGFPLPSKLRGGPVVIAIRMWMASASRFSAPDAGGLHGPPMLGLAPAVANYVQLDWDDDAHQVGSGFLELLVLIVALGVSLTHFGLDRSDRAYLWLGIVSLVTLLRNLIVLLEGFTTAISLHTATIARDVVLTPLRIGIWVLFWASWFGLGPPKWLQRAVWDLMAVLALVTLLLRGQFLPPHTAAYLLPGVLWMKLAFAGLLLWVTWKGIQKDRAEGWLAVPAILLAVIANFQQELRQIHVPITFSVFRFEVSIGEASTTLSLLLVTLMASRRFLQSQRRKVQWRLEVEQARELQRVIIPTNVPAVAGLRIESDYRPSREVGGDFFQIIPDREDGSVLVIVGDVTGKGLRAGMLVALLVGAIDAAAKDDPDPERVLMRLNERICERGYATATCLAMKISADGCVSIANAGHLPPYLNGLELEMEGALPLGTIPGMDYTSTRLNLKEGDSLMLMTDGVVEAQDEKGQLFGFDRTSEMIARHATATDLANAAQHFGQEDDILVLRVERTAMEVTPITTFA